MWIVHTLIRCAEMTLDSSCPPRWPLSQPNNSNQIPIKEHLAKYLAACGKTVKITQSEEKSEKLLLPIGAEGTGQLNMMWYTTNLGIEKRHLIKFKNSE